MDGRKLSFRKRRLKGYTSVFLVIIVLSMVLTCLVMVEASAGIAARSIGENVCASAGRSVLSEFQKDLFKRYGIFAIRDSRLFLQSKASFYIESSLAAGKGLVRLKADRIVADTSDYKIENKELLRQIGKVSIGLDMYILDHFSNRLSSREDTYLVSETEYIICGKKDEDSNQKAVRNKIYTLRTALDIAKLYADPALVARYEAEALLLFPGLPPGVGAFLMISARAAAMAERETKQILAGEKVPILDVLEVEMGGSYRDYLLVFLLTMSEKEKISRMKISMERNLVYVDKTDFSFEDYVFGFDLKVDLSKNASAQMLGITKRKGSVRQSFSYK